MDLLDRIKNPLTGEQLVHVGGGKWIDDDFFDSEPTARDAVELLGLIEPDKVRQMFKQGAVNINGIQCKDERRLVTRDDFDAVIGISDSLLCRVGIGKKVAEFLVLHDPDPVEPTSCVKCNFMRRSNEFATCSGCKSNRVGESHAQMG